MLQKTPNVSNVRKTGKGQDFGVDIVFELRERGLLGSPSRTLKGIAQCKHKAKSGSAVREQDLRVMDTIVAHDADFYLLATTTDVGPYWAKVLDQINLEPKGRRRAVLWNATELETQLLKPKNDVLFQRPWHKSPKKS